MSHETLWILYLVGSALLGGVAVFLGMLFRNQRLDDGPLDAEALCRLSEMKREQARLPIMLRRQAD